MEVPSSVVKETMKRKGEEKTEGEEGCPKKQKLESNGHNYDEDNDNDYRKGPSQGKHNQIVEGRRDCPYLDSVNRKVLLSPNVVVLLLCCVCSFFNLNLGRHNLHVK